MSLDSRQNLRFITLLQAKQASLYFTWRSHVYLYSSKAVVEEAGVQAGSFLFLTAHPASEVWRRYTRGLLLSLLISTAFM